MVVKELVAKLGLNIDGSAFAAADAAINGLRTNFLKVGLVLGAAVTGMAAAAVGTAHAASEIEDLHTRTNIARGSLQELRYASGQVGVGFESLVQGITLMTRNAVEASQGSKEAAGNFAQIGIDPGRFKDSDALLGAVADKIKALKDSGQDMKATAAAMDIFGRSGASLIPLLARGSEGIEAFRRRARLLGAVMSDDMIKAGDDLDDVLGDMRFALEGVRNMIAGPLLVPVKELINAFAEWIGANREIIGQRIETVVGGISLAFNVLATVLGPVLGALGWILTSQPMLIAGMIIFAGVMADRKSVV